MLEHVLPKLLGVTTLNMMYDDECDPHALPVTYDTRPLLLAQPQRHFQLPHSPCKTDDVCHIRAGCKGSLATKYAAPDHWTSPKQSSYDKSNGGLWLGLVRHCAAAPRGRRATWGVGASPAGGAPPPLNRLAAMIRAAPRAGPGQSDGGGP